MSLDTDFWIQQPIWGSVFLPYICHSDQR